MGNYHKTYQDRTFEWLVTYNADRYIVVPVTYPESLRPGLLGEGPYSYEFALTRMHQLNWDAGLLNGNQSDRHMMNQWRLPEYSKPIAEVGCKATGQAAPDLRVTQGKVFQGNVK